MVLAVRPRRLNRAFAVLCIDSSQFINPKIQVFVTSLAGQDGLMECQKPRRKVHVS